MRVTLTLCYMFIILKICDESQHASKLAHEGDRSHSSHSVNAETTSKSVKPEEENKTLLFSPAISSVCKTNVNCSDLPADCLQCEWNSSCVYGEPLNVTCQPLPEVECIGNYSHQRWMLCRYCYQTDLWEHVCQGKADCHSAMSPRQYYRANCSVLAHIVCMGNRVFFKKLPCNWTNGYSYWKALLLSIVAGGFGADRFYLGYWQEGVGKLFSFGGLGLWTLLDILLIALQYLKPADGSLYI